MKIELKLPKMSEIKDMIFNVHIDIKKREVVRVVKTNPRKDRLGLDLPLVSSFPLKENDLLEVFPVMYQGRRGYIYIEKATTPSGD